MVVVIVMVAMMQETVGFCARNESDARDCKLIQVLCDSPLRHKTLLFARWIDDVDAQAIRTRICGVAKQEFEMLHYQPRRTM